MASTVRSSFLILADAHDNHFGDNSSSKLQLLVPKVDVLHSGDSTPVGGVAAFKKCLGMLSNFGFTAELKLAIARNHNWELNHAWCVEYLDDDLDYLDDHAAVMEVMEFMKGILAREAGVTYLEEGTREVTYSVSFKNAVTFKIYTSPC